MKLVFLLASGYGNDLPIDKKDGSKVTLILQLLQTVVAIESELRVKAEKLI